MAARRSPDRLIVSHAVKMTIGNSAATTSTIRCARTDARRASSARTPAAGGIPAHGTGGLGADRTLRSVQRAEPDSLSGAFSPIHS